MPAPERIADQLRREIRRGEIPPGGLLVQDELARRFGVSRNPLREALAALSGEGLVELRAGRRAVVRELSPAELVELYDLRICLEPVLAPWIIDAAAPRDVAALRTLARTTAQAEGTGDWLEANYELHSALYALANRPRTQEICLSLLGASQPYSAINIGRLGGRGQAEAEHEGMIAAIEGRDAPGLAALMVAHLSHARTALTASDS